MWVRYAQALSKGNTYNWNYLSCLAHKGPGGWYRRTQGTPPVRDIRQCTSSHLCLCVTGPELPVDKSPEVFRILRWGELVKTEDTQSDDEVYNEE